MKRGEIWTVSGGSGYTGKPRPAVILQDDHFSALASITICVFTSDETEAPLFRIAVEPSDENGLKATSRMMADKVSTVHKGRLGRKIGELSSKDMVRLERSLMVFLGIG
ncbi:MAG: growth inhibitor PemK [Robiginitomaculum sp.]|nr:MAG: growth inhibitor PemK [Robiginitomaculum sp.]